MNNKGFTLVEILTTIVIIALISMIGVIAYTRQLDRARQKAYDTMAQSAAEAASEYSMDYLGVKSVTFDTLVKNDYLEDPSDPAGNIKSCVGKVDIIETTTKTNNSETGDYKQGLNALETYEYDVIVCCSNYNYKYHFPGGKKKKITAPEIVCPYDNRGNYE